MDRSGKTTTLKGRVVYDRKRHFWRISRVTGILQFIINNYRYDDLLSQAVPINSLRTVVEKSLYPFYLEDLDRSRTVRDYLGPEETAIIEQEFKEAARKMANRLGEEVGVPLKIREFVLRYLFNPIWDIVDGIIGRFF